MCTGWRIWQISVPSVQFLCEPKTILKIFLLKVRTAGSILMEMKMFAILPISMSISCLLYHVITFQDVTKGVNWVKGTQDLLYYFLKYM